jgi:hypothetical protein
MSQCAATSNDFVYWEDSKLFFTFSLWRGTNVLAVNSWQDPKTIASFLSLRFRNSYSELSQVALPSVRYAWCI